MISTLINAAAVLAGTTLGLLFGKKLPETFRQIVMTASGLVTLVIGFGMALETESYLVMLFSVIIGGFIGFALHIEEHILSLGNRFEKPAEDGSKSGRFGEGFLISSLLFCSGSMSVVGSINAGTTGDGSLILIKSVMDGFMAIVFAAAYGPGVYLSIASILVYQGFFTLAGGWLAPILGEIGINELSAVGGILLMMVGLGLLEIKKIKTGNFLPALILAPLFAVLFLA